MTYKAKAFIDMFAQRFAKVLSVAVNLGLVSVAAVWVRWLSLVSIFALALWTLSIRRASRIYRSKTSA